MLKENHNFELLFKWFDQTLPITNFQKFSNTVMFDLFDYKIKIVVEESVNHCEAKWILQWLPNDPKGYVIDILINDITDIDDISSEFLVFTEVLNQTNNLVTNLDWNYLVFKGIKHFRNKIPEAVAQRLTKLQPTVERIANRHPLTLIARF